MSTDNQATESIAGDIDVNQATGLFASILEPKDDSPVEKGEKIEAQDEGKEEVKETEVDGEANEEVDEQEDDAEPTFTVKIDGKEVEVNLAELKNGYQRQADYTRKTTVVAEQAKAVQAEIQKTQQERAEYAQKLDFYAQNLQSVVSEQSNIDWNALLESNPVEYLKQKHTFEQRQVALQQAQQEQFNLKQKQQSEQADDFQRFVNSQKQLLEEQLPEWKDTKKASAEKEQMRQFLKDQGMTDGQINGIIDHRAILITRKAMLFDKLIKEAPEVTKRVDKLPAKVVKPGNTEKSGTDARTTAFRQFNKTGRVEDAAAVFASIL